MKKICLIGYPAKHSLSPEIHSYWMAEHGITGKYEICETEPDKFDALFSNLHNEGYVGCNITIPFKERAFCAVKNMGKILNRSTNILGVVNTVVINNGVYEGVTTDGEGFYNNLLTSNIDFLNGNIVVMGAGGAARAIVGILLEKIASTSNIILLNRTIEKAEKIKKDLSLPGIRTELLQIAPWEQIDTVLKQASLLVNTTSLGMTGQEALNINLSLLPKNALVTDIVYKPLITPLLQAAKDRGNPIVDGLGMLLYQAVPGFAMWFAEEMKGTRPEVTKGLRIKVEALL